MMRVQAFVVRGTQRALDDIIRAANAVPSDRLEWSAEGAARSVLNQMQEVAQSASWLRPIIENHQVPAGSTDHSKEAEKPPVGTLEQCVAAARESTALLCEAIMAVPDDALEDEIRMPFGGGMIMTMADVIDLHRWNLVYHLGQVNQVQLMLGDRAMH